MLIVTSSISKIDARKLMDVYAGSKKYHSLNDFYNMLYYFFDQPNALYAIWQEEGEYVSAMRVESFMDGMLIAGLETKPSARRKGYARELLKNTLPVIYSKGVHKVYSHIEKRNRASLNLHKQLGFKTVSDHATLLDGTVSSCIFTMCKENTVASH